MPFNTDNQLYFLMEQLLPLNPIFFAPFPGIPQVPGAGMNGVQLWRPPLYFQRKQQGHRAVFHADFKETSQNICLISSFSDEAL
ncbi:hypothetical protein FKM82_022431 [Ascaphus truei]